MEVKFREIKAPKRFGTGYQTKIIVEDEEINDTLKQLDSIKETLSLKLDEYKKAAGDYGVIEAQKGKLWRNAVIQCNSVQDKESKEYNDAFIKAEEAEEVYNEAEDQSNAVGDMVDLLEDILERLTKEK